MRRAPLLSGPLGLGLLLTGTPATATAARTTTYADPRCLDARGAVGSARLLGSYVAHHEGYLRNASGRVRPDGTFRRGTYATSRRQYDVKQFLVTVTDSALEPANP